MAEEGVILVAADGSGQFESIQAAIDSIPADSSSPVTIMVQPGTYREQVVVPSSKSHLTLCCSHPSSALISFDAFNGSPHPNGSSFSSFDCATLQVDAPHFTAVNLSIENSAGRECGGSSGQHQAVAVRASGDFCRFFRCQLLGWQATLYAHRGCQFYSECYIRGSVDFIFGGPSVKALFSHCTVAVAAAGFITAHYRSLADDPDDDGAFVFSNCCITYDSNLPRRPLLRSSFLGRPWREDARVVLSQSFIDSCVNASGWSKWDDNTDEARVAFLEQDCSGPGSIGSLSDPSLRVMGREASAEEVEPFILQEQFFSQADGPFPGDPPPSAASPLPAEDCHEQTGTPLFKLEVADWPGKVHGPRRELLVDPNASEGSDTFSSIQAAVGAVPSGNRQEVVIRVTAGDYYEKVHVGWGQDFITLKGEERGRTRLHFDAFIGKEGPDGCDPYTTYSSATLVIEAQHFTAVDLVVENSAGPCCGGDSGFNQAVAVRSSNDSIAFYNCDLLAHQDTLYAHTGTAYFQDCRIEGDVDFIFGGPKIKAYFKGCRLFSRGRGWVTAQKKDKEQQPDDEGGFVFDSCSFEADESLPQASVLLGRPWGADATVVLFRCELGEKVSGEGWSVWDSNTDASRPMFLECQCTGPGAVVEGVNRFIGRIVEEEEISSFVPAEKFFQKDGFPASISPS